MPTIDRDTLRSTFREDVLAQLDSTAAQLFAAAPDAETLAIRHGFTVTDADLAEAAEGDFCQACARPSIECSVNPCQTVIDERAESDETCDECDAHLDGPHEPGCTRWDTF